MNRPRRHPARLVLLGLALALSGCMRAGDVLPVYLTWAAEDATTTMVVQYHTRGPSQGSHVHYDTAPRGGDPAAYAFHAEGFEKRLAGVDRTVHVVELAGLAPDTVYWFVAGDPVSGRRKERSFRTPPAEGPLTFVYGGDMGTGLLPRMIAARAAAQSPSFAVIGGDLAYAYGDLKHLPRWERWFADWEATMRTPEGHLIPMILAIGNHELNEGPADRPAAERAPFYHLFFHQGPDERSFFVRRFGPDVALWVLDSGHLVRHADQRDWLEQGLRRLGDARFRFAAYHIGLYPGHHPFEALGSVAGRRYWLPLFDAYHLTAALEAHDHMEKRTLPLRAGQVVGPDAGTLYVGGGCWGKAHVEEPTPDLWYMAKMQRRRHFWRITLDGDVVRYTALGAAGQVLDEAVQRVGDGS